MELHPVDAGPEILQHLPALTAMVGMPLGDPSVLAAHAVARQARADGVRVLLSGEGADELFLGYRRHRLANRLPRRGPLQNPFGWPNSGMSMASSMRILRCLADKNSYDALLEVSPPGFRRAVLSPELLAGHLPEGPAGSGLDRARHTDRMTYLRSDLLPKLDTALMAAGIEGRCPFLDPQVLHCEEALASDSRSILGKRQLREAYRGALPPGVLDGPKIGFGLPLDRWLREDDYLADILSDRRTTERPHIQAAGLRRMLDGHRSGRYQHGHALYLVAAMECYLRYADVPEEVMA
jgi:asparagine synthase (glutamine-hydrolysing)